MTGGGAVARTIFEIRFGAGDGPGRFRQLVRENGEENDFLKGECEIPHLVSDLNLEAATGAGEPGIVYRRSGEETASPAGIMINTVAQMQAIGARLFEHWLSSRLQVLIGNRKSGERVELRFDLTECPDLADAPFELLGLPEEDTVHFLATSAGTPVSRYFAKGQSSGSPPKPRIEGVARALLLAANPASGPELDILAEIEAVTRLKLEQMPTAPDTKIEVPPAADGLIRWTVMANVSKPGLIAQLGEHWDIIHFVGHGGFDEAEGRHFIEVHHYNPDLPEPVFDEELREALRNSLPSLVVLNACGTGKTTLVRYFTGLARTLVRAQVPYVVAMRTDVPDEVARRFAARFYRELAQTDALTGDLNSPTVAAALGRHAILTASGNDSWMKLSFAIPVIYSSLPNDQLGPLLSLPAPAVPVPLPVLPDNPRGVFARGWAWIARNDKQVMVLTGIASLVVGAIGVMLALGDESSAPLDANGDPPAQMGEPVGSAPDDAQAGSEGEEAMAGSSGEDIAESSGPPDFGGGYSDYGWGGRDPAGGYGEPVGYGSPVGAYPSDDEGRLDSRPPDDREIGFGSPEPSAQLPPAPPPPPVFASGSCLPEIVYFTGSSDMPLTDWARGLDLRYCYTERVLVVGHTDRVLSEAESFALSLRRAERIKAELRAILPDAEIYVLGAGESQPRIATIDGEAASGNNRVEIIELDLDRALPEQVDAAQIAYETARGAYRRQLRALESEVEASAAIQPDETLSEPVRAVFDRLEGERLASEALLRAERAATRETIADFDIGQAAVARQIDTLRAARAEADMAAFAVRDHAAAIAVAEEAIAQGQSSLAIPTLTSRQRSALRRALEAATSARAETYVRNTWTIAEYRDDTARLDEALAALSDALEEVADQRVAYREKLWAEQRAISVALEDHSDLRVEITSPYMHPDDRRLALCDGYLLRDGLYVAFGMADFGWNAGEMRQARDSLAVCAGRRDREVAEIFLPVPDEGPASSARTAADTPNPLDRFTVTTQRRSFDVYTGPPPGEGSRLEVRLRIAGLPQLDYEERGDALVVPTRQIDLLAGWLKAADRRAAERDDCTGRDCPAQVPAFAAIHLEMPLGEGENFPAVAERHAEWLAMVADRVRRAYGGRIKIEARQCAWPWTERAGDGWSPVPNAGGAAIAVVPHGVELMLDQCRAETVPPGE
ncbi:CHAT domain-containing protein [Porphyrobacter sp. YT40]|uniref:CHAT domain-containing protein n=1 Tax=Porphyrobacter sp. YT40 TaxID=2547601 RepID=UPI0011416476|nr:CHAT domain-containing protein [Porphyrobacter sp. YT40]QDH34303.1 CHAT domain-containing protein [Porphyrobacter sp. YT40]